MKKYHVGMKIAVHHTHHPWEGIDNDMKITGCEVSISLMKLCPSFHQNNMKHKKNTQEEYTTIITKIQLIVSL